MELREMKCIASVAKEGNLARAGEKLYLTQPAVSRMVAKVENELGVLLFDRKKTPWVLTYAGELLLKSSYQIFEIEKEFLSDMRAIIDEQKGIIKMGVMVFEEKYIIGKTMPLFKEKHPDFQIELIGTLPVDLEKKILDNEVDIGIIGLPAKYKSELEYIPIKTYSRLIALSPDHGLAKNYKFPKDHKQFPEMDLTLLANDPFVLLSDSYFSRNHAISMCKEAGFEPKIGYNVRTVEACHNLVKSGGCVSFILDELTKFQAPSQRLAYFKVKDQQATQTIAFAYKKGKKLRPAEQTLLDLLSNNTKKPLSVC